MSTENASVFVLQYLKCVLTPGREGPKIRRSETNFFGNKYILKKIKLFLENSKLNALIYIYLT